MKKQSHLLFYLLGVLFFTIPIYAQNDTSRKSILSVHVGPSWYVGQLMGITDNTNSYSNDLRKGIAWEVSYWFPRKGPFEKGIKVGPGFIYQGSLYKKAQENSSDKIAMHYLAPQLGLFFFQNRYQIQLSTGIGYQFYSNKSQVYGKPRDVSMDKLAGNISLIGEYFLAKQWGLSAKLNWLISDSERYKVSYHGNSWEVEHPQTGEGYFGQLSLIFGLNYHF